jgi:flagellar basal body rod protein FlgB
MSFDSLNSIDKSQLMLDAISKKQQVLGANLANMNTPGYVRRDVNFAQLLSDSNSPLETQLSTKLGPSPYMLETGGEVSAPQELIAMQKNALFYTIASRRVTSAITQLRTVSQVGK